MASAPLPACLSLGSNLGTRRLTLAAAIRALDDHDAIEVKACSAFYETEPVGLKGPPFVNLACVLATPLSPAALHQACLRIEKHHGRRRTGVLVSRTLDIDIIFYGAEILATDQLEIPHPRFASRRFVLVPLAEVAADWRDPVSGLTVGRLLQRCPDSSRVRRHAGTPFQRPPDAII